MGKNASVWFGAVLRADMQPITVGENTNIQDNAVIHVGPNTPAVIGDNVTVGHGAIIHGATVGNNVLVGMGATVLDGAVIGDNCIVGAGALVTSNTQIPANSMALGMPAKVIKALTPSQVMLNRMSALEYVKLAKDFQKD
ncbi:MAG: gamma carbonic anhydrase family protein [Clostridia bacterium]|nr:gamma carbonic anhydrase family protein [Clostridia bacterium]